MISDKASAFLDKSRILESTPFKVGDEISVHTLLPDQYGSIGIVRKCQHTQRSYVAVNVECCFSPNDPPHDPSRYLVGNARCTHGLKAYLRYVDVLKMAHNPTLLGVKKVVVVGVRIKSLEVRVLEWVAVATQPLTSAVG